MTLYPTAGTWDNYAFNRHSVDAKQVKIFSYTIELGGPQNPTPFHPPYPEMKQIIEEVTSDLQRSVSRRSRAGYGGCRADWIRSAPCQPRHVVIPKPFTTSMR
ncbi:hypothetical protein PTKU46_93880 [Paraburkholderia terrae]|uniref:hypothetical protein n=1 Tax=Paraburkholderia terrae TaxID=311230 RepID=UPI0030DF8C20